MAQTYNEVGYNYNDVNSQYNTLAASATAAWPVAPIQLRVDLQLNGIWTNVTSDVYASEKVMITRGRPDEASSAQASSCVLTLNNRTGKYTPRNPAGAYYGQIGRNTPIRVGIGVPPNGTATGNQAASTTITAPAIVAEASGVVLYMWAQQSNTATITPPIGISAPQQVGASPVGLTSVVSAASVTGPATTLPASATSSVSAVGSAVSVFIPGSSIPPAPVQANGQYSFTASGFGPSAGSANPITVAAGDVLVALMAWGNDPRNAMICSPVDNSQSVEWTLVADSGPGAGPRCQAWARYCPVADTFSVGAPGECYGGNDVQLNIYQLKNAAAWNPRYTGACSDFSTTADPSGKDVRTTISCGQVLRQRGQGQQAQESALYRYITDKTPTAYWPLETGTLGGVFNSPIPGVAPAVPFAVSSGADSSSFVASSALPQTAVNGSIAFPVPNYTSGTAVPGSVFFVANITGVGGNPSTFFSIKFVNDGTSASLQSIAVQYVNATTVNLVTVAGNSSAIVNSFSFNIPTTAGATIGGSVTGVPLGWFISWLPNVSNPTTQTDFQFNMVTTNGIVSQGGWVLGLTGRCGRVYQMGAALDQFLSNTMNTVCTFGHVMFDASPASYDGRAVPNVIPESRVFPNINCAAIVGGFNNEPQSLRLRRICQDESIFLSSALLTSESADTNNIRHGPQTIDNGLDLIALTQTTDGGELAEARGFNGLLYRPLGALGSRPVLQALDYNAKMIAEPFAPTDDDQLIRNDVTISQVNGGSARAFLSTGMLSNQPPPNGVGTYTSSITVDTAQQGRDLQQIANWQLSLGTFDAERFKQARMLLEAVPASANNLALIDIGNHVQIVNTPNWVQVGPSDLIVLGLQELIGTVAEWEITLSGRPYGPFNILRMDGGDQFARLDSGSSTLTSGVASGVTSLSITTTRTTDLWSTTAPPFDILIGGERMTVTAVTGTSSPQTFTVVRSVNGVVKAQTTGAAVDVFYQTRLALNGGG